jgi:hypothetical protein
MNTRTIRRAIERKARKQAQKEAARSLATASGSLAAPVIVEEDMAEEPRTISESQLNANRRNPTLSTGPVTAEGKSRSSRNALKTGLTGRTVLLPTEDAELYDLHVQRFKNELRPVGDRETELVQAIADTQWRLGRIPSLEMGIYALGRQQFAEQHQNLDPKEASALIEVQTFLAYQKQLNNLSVQEARLRRQYEKDLAELQSLQKLRIEVERIRQAAAKTDGPKPRSERNGFEFSTIALDGFEASAALKLDETSLHGAA